MMRASAGAIFAPVLVCPTRDEEGYGEGRCQHWEVLRGVEPQSVPACPARSRESLSAVRERDRTTQGTIVAENPSAGAGLSGAGHSGGSQCASSVVVAVRWVRGGDDDMGIPEALGVFGEAPGNGRYQAARARRHGSAGVIPKPQHAER